MVSELGRMDMTFGGNGEKLLAVMDQVEEKAIKMQRVSKQGFDPSYMDSYGEAVAGTAAKSKALAGEARKLTQTVGVLTRQTEIGRSEWGLLMNTMWYSGRSIGVPIQGMNVLWETMSVGRQMTRGMGDDLNNLTQDFNLVAAAGQSMKQMFAGMGTIVMGLGVAGMAIGAVVAAAGMFALTWSDLAKQDEERTARFEKDAKLREEVMKREAEAYQSHYTTLAQLYQDFLKASGGQAKDYRGRDITLEENQRQIDRDRAINAAEKRAGGTSSVEARQRELDEYVSKNKVYKHDQEEREKYEKEKQRLKESVVAAKNRDEQIVSINRLYDAKELQAKRALEAAKEEEAIRAGEAQGLLQEAAVEEANKEFREHEVAQAKKAAALEEAGEKAGAWQEAEVQKEVDAWEKGVKDAADGKLAILQQAAGEERKLNEETARQNPAFNASFMGIADMGKRIQAAAASTAPPELKTLAAKALQAEHDRRLQVDYQKRIADGVEAINAGFGN